MSDNKMTKAIYDACGELVVSKWLKVDWDVNCVAVDDFGPLHVRTTSDERACFLHGDDPDDDIFLLVLGHHIPRFHLACLLRARKLQKWWR